MHRQLREDFFRKLNGTGISIINTNSARAAGNWYCLLNSKNITVIKMIVNYTRSLFETRESLLLIASMASKYIITIAPNY